MGVLKLQFVDGSEQRFPFEATSTVTVSTDGWEDGAVRTKSLTWSEITGLEVVADEEYEVYEPAAEPEPDALSTVETEPAVASDSTVVLTEPVGSIPIADEWFGHPTEDAPQPDAATLTEPAPADEPEKKKGMFR